MDFWLNVVMRWLHVAAAVAGVGGTLVMRLVLLPVLDRLPNGAEVLGAIRRPFKALIHGAIGMLLVTGFYNYVVVAIPKVRAYKDAALQSGAPDPLAPYNGVMGAKILLSFVL